MRDSLGLTSDSLGIISGSLKFGSARLVSDNLKLICDSLGVYKFNSSGFMSKSLGFMSDSVGFISNSQGFISDSKGFIPNSLGMFECAALICWNVSPGSFLSIWRHESASMRDLPRARALSTFYLSFQKEKAGHFFKYTVKGMCHEFEPWLFSLLGLLKQKRESRNSSRGPFKGAVSRDFRPLFFHESNPSGPLINRLKCFFKNSFSQRY